MEKLATKNVEKVARLFLDIFEPTSSVTVINKGGISEALKNTALNPDKNEVTGSIVEAVSSGVFASTVDESINAFASAQEENNQKH